MTVDYGRMTVEVTDGVFSEFAHDRIQLMRRTEHSRRWWQLWKPKTWLVNTLLFEKPYTLHAGDVVHMSGHPGAFVLSVNGKTVLDWPIHQPPSRGWGITSGLPALAPALQPRFTS